MTNDSTTPQRRIGASAQRAESLFNELADLIFLTLNSCTSESQLAHFCQLAEEKGVALGHIVAAGLTQTILHHYEIQPKPNPTEFNA